VTFNAVANAGRRAVAVVATLLLVASIGAAQSPENDSTMLRAEAAWKQRATEFKSFIIRWRVTGAYFDHPQQEWIDRNREHFVATEPQEPVTFDFGEHSLQCSGDRCLYSAPWSFPAGHAEQALNREFSPANSLVLYEMISRTYATGSDAQQGYASWFDGQTSVLELHDREAEVRYSRRVKQAAWKDARCMVLRPLLLALKPTIPGLLPSALRRYRCVESLESDGHQIMVLEVAGSAPEQIWVDADRNFVPIRLVDNPQGWPRPKVDIEYTQHPSLGWIPDRWTVAFQQFLLRPAVLLQCEVVEAVAVPNLVVQALHERVQPRSWIREYDAAGKSQDSIVDDDSKSQLAAAIDARRLAEAAGFSVAAAANLENAPNYWYWGAIGGFGVLLVVALILKSKYDF
jgi:hypothetical protein